MESYPWQGQPGQCTTTHQRQAERPTPVNEPPTADPPTSLLQTVVLNCAQSGLSRCMRSKREGGAKSSETEGKPNAIGWTQGLNEALLGLIRASSPHRSLCAPLLNSAASALRHRDVAGKKTLEHRVVSQCLAQPQLLEQAAAAGQILLHRQRRGSHRHGIAGEHLAGPVIVAITAGLRIRLQRLQQRVVGPLCEGRETGGRPTPLCPDVAGTILAAQVAWLGARHGSSGALAHSGSAQCICGRQVRQRNNPTVNRNMPGQRAGVIDAGRAALPKM